MFNNSNRDEPKRSLERSDVQLKESETWARSGKLRERLTISVTEPAVFPHLPVQVPDFLIVPLLVLILVRGQSSRSCPRWLFGIVHVF